MHLSILEDEADDLANIIQDQSVGGKTSGVAMPSRNCSFRQVCSPQDFQAVVPHSMYEEEGLPADVPPMVVKEGSVPLALG